ncbi:MAG TPA: hypothetical protein VMT12_02490 [Syntrophales bacterium]|nr:hypothetical protein [Syntrophales bacterium]
MKVLSFLRKQESRPVAADAGYELTLDPRRGLPSNVLIGGGNDRKGFI